MHPSYIRTVLTGPVLGRLCAANHSSDEFMRAVAMSQIHSFLWLSYSSLVSHDVFCLSPGAGDIDVPLTAEHSAVTYLRPVMDLQ